MLIAQNRLQIGDVAIMAKGSLLCLIKILSITKSGYLRYSFSENMDKRYYERKFEANVAQHNKIGYLAKPDNKFSQYFYLLNRTNE